MAGTPLWFWLAFNAFVIAMLVLDQLAFHRKSRTISLRESLAWSAVWISLALIFNVGIYFWKGEEPALQFFTGYLIEKSLSVDNLFVFVLIFAYFKVPSEHQQRVLAWGIIGALVMRTIMIIGGAILVQRFEWLLYIFGAFLVFTGIKIAIGDDTSIEPEKNPVLRLARRLFPITPEYHGNRFMVKIDGKRLFTPLFVVVLVVESTDVIFAVDSIPAIFGVTKDPFIVYTSNIFAILGLRALYFALANVIQLFHYLKLGLGAVLTFVGTKMLLGYFHIHIPTLVALLLVVLILTVSIAASLIWPQHPEDTSEDTSAQAPTPPSDGDIR